MPSRPLSGETDRLVMHVKRFHYNVLQAIRLFCKSRSLTNRHSTDHFSSRGLVEETSQHQLTTRPRAVADSLNPFGETTDESVDVSAGDYKATCQRKAGHAVDKCWEEGIAICSKKSPETLATQSKKMRGCELIHQFHVFTLGFLRGKELTEYEAPVLRLPKYPIWTSGLAEIIGDYNEYAFDFE